MKAVSCRLMPRTLLLYNSPLFSHVSDVLHIINPYKYIFIRYASNINPGTLRCCGREHEFKLALSEKKKRTDSLRNCTYRYHRQYDCYPSLRLRVARPPTTRTNCGETAKYNIITTGTILGLTRAIRPRMGFLVHTS